MNINIDYREKDLIAKISQIIKDIPLFNKIIFNSSNLPLGDITFNENETIKLLIERKTVSDLISSVKDGRYEEQSLRLNALNHPNHNIIYIIEGDLRKINHFQSKSFDKLTLYSTIFSLNFYKGFSVIRTFDLEETAVFLLNSFNKISKDLTRLPFYEMKNHSFDNKFESKDYVDVIKTVKKENITPENINEIMLCQIPGISTITAKAILLKYNSINNIINALKNDINCLLELSVESKSGKKRKINKNIGTILAKYLVTN